MSSKNVAIVFSTLEDLTEYSAERYTYAREMAKTYAREMARTWFKIISGALDQAKIKNLLKK